MSTYMIHFKIQMLQKKMKIVFEVISQVTRLENDDLYVFDTTVMDANERERDRIRK